MFLSHSETLHCEHKLAKKVVKNSTNVAYNLGETQTCNNIVLLFCREILESVWQEEENFEVLTQIIYIQVYLVFCCVKEKLLIFYIFEI